MIEITDKEIEKLATLSALEFDDAEKVEVTKKLNSIIDMLAKCAEAEVEPLEHTNRISISELREDIAEESTDRETILQNAPKQRRGYFNVPKVVD